jgi:hypothetical protein
VFHGVHLSSCWTPSSPCTATDSICVARTHTKEYELRINIRQKLAARGEKDKELVAADAEYVEPFMDVFNEMFVWLPGEYTLDLKIQVESGKSAFGKRYRFTLFESDSEELKSHTDDFKYGGGLSYNVDRHVGIYVPLSPNDT